MEDRIFEKVFQLNWQENKLIMNQLEFQKKLQKYLNYTQYTKKLLMKML